MVITTGGLGPTCDDRTREAVAEVLGQKLVFDPAIEQAIADRFARLGRKMTPNNLKQAYRFERGEVLPNANGTAPGLWVEQDGKVLVMLPGPPNELQPLFTEQVLPRLAQLGLISEGEAYVQLRTAGVGESALETKLQPIFDRAGGALSVAYCAHQWRVDVRLSSPGGRLSMPRTAGRRRRVRRAAAARILCATATTRWPRSSRTCSARRRRRWPSPNRARAACWPTCSPTSAAPPSFSAAPSSATATTSKMQILDVPECLIEQHGAVSDECAVALATSVAETLEADYGLAITGYAGPSGGTEEEPVGTIYLGLHSPQGVWSKKLNYTATRTMVKERAVTVALDWLRRELVRAARNPAALIRRAPLIG